MLKLVLCSVAVTLGIQAQENPALRMRSVLPGPPAHSDPAHLQEATASPQPVATQLASGALTSPGIVYTCDPTISALSPSVCNTLNTTIAGLYRTVFSNANATIYVKLGNTALGQSESYSTSVDYG